LPSYLLSSSSGVPGPFNSWDRQPYIYRADEHDNRTAPAPDGTPRLMISPQTQLIRQNLIFSYNFHGPSCASIALDHDDESSQYEDSRNVLVYGGIKFFDGMDKTASSNLVLFPNGVMHGFECFHALSSTRNLSSAHSHFVGNQCVMRPKQTVYNCGAGPSPFYNKSYHVAVANNTFTYPGATADPAEEWGGVCACWPSARTDAPQPCPVRTFQDWQALGLDAGSQITTEWSNDAILADAAALLGMA
jgi:hypothetical protein